MTLGEKVKTARLALGLSQRQLCGQYMTRNMLSLIESGSARPSMDTLRFLAGQLGKPVSYFLEDAAVVSDNTQVMEQARTCLALGDLPGLRKALDSFREPDGVFGEERQLLEFLYLTARAERALAEDQMPYAVTLLERALDLSGLYLTAPLVQRCRVLLTLAGGRGGPVAEDDALLALAMEAQDPQRKRTLLAAAADGTDPLRCRRKAQVLLDCGEYEKALALLERCPPDREALLAMERCCKELGDYKRAYEIACQLR